MGQRMRVSRDDGFTVVEVVVAAMIMFFVLTAIVGLMGASSSMTVQAKQRAVMTNTVASYLDGLRTAAWEDVVQPSGPVVLTRNGITVTMNVSVETRQEEGQDIIKVIRISAVSSLNGKSQMYETSVALLRNPNFNRTLKTDPAAPVVYFMGEAPDDDEVIWADQQDGGPIFLRTKAFSPEDKITEVRYDVTGREVVDSLAVFTPNPLVQTYYSSPTLNTVAEGIGDGFQTVSVLVTDDYARTGTVKRRFIVDNEAPSDPGASTITSITSSALMIEWPAATDGGTFEAPNYASHYECEVSVEPTQGQSSLAPDRVILNEPRWLAGNNTALAISNDGPIYYEAIVADGLVNVAQRAVPPFSRFDVRVRASSPRGLTTGNWIDAVARGYTRPELFCEDATSVYRSTCKTTVWGTGADKGTQYDLDFWVSRAAFQRASGDSPVWEIQYQSAVTTPTPTGWKTFTTSPSLVDYDAFGLHLKASKKFYPPAVPDGTPMYFRIKMSGYAARRDGGAIVPPMFTNAAGPSKLDLSPVYLAKTWDY